MIITCLNFTVCRNVLRYLKALGALVSSYTQPRPVISQAAQMHTHTNTHTQYKLHFSLLHWLYLTRITMHSAHSFIWQWTKKHANTIQHINPVKTKSKEVSSCYQIWESGLKLSLNGLLLRLSAGDSNLLFMNSHNGKTECIKKHPYFHLFGLPFHSSCAPKQPPVQICWR